MRSAVRSVMAVSAVSAIVLGVVLIVWPGPTLTAVAVLFGLWLVVGGALRIAAAVSSRFLGTGTRWAVGLLGALVAVAGVICLFHPGDALWVLAVVIGVSWIADGAAALFSGAGHDTVGPRWLYVLGAVVSVLAGIAVVAMPALAVSVFALWGGLLLVIVGVVTLFSLPRKERRPVA